MSYGQSMIKPAGSQEQQADAFSHSHYMVRRKVLTLMGGKFHVYDGAGRVVMFAKMKAFKLKEDISIYSDETMQVELLRIMARQIIDFSATYDIIDSRTDQAVGSLRRRGMKSILRDHWLLFDAQGHPMGELIEDSMGMALLRRFLSNLIPQRFDWQFNGATVCTFHQIGRASCRERV